MRLCTNPTCCLQETFLLICADFTVKGWRPAAGCLTRQKSLAVKLSVPQRLEHRAPLPAVPVTSVKAAVLAASPKSKVFFKLPAANGDVALLLLSVLSFNLRASVV